jgi:hypothetical protein
LNGLMKGCSCRCHEVLWLLPSSPFFFLEACRTALDSGRHIVLKSHSRLCTCGLHAEGNGRSVDLPTVVRMEDSQSNPPGREISKHGGRSHLLSLPCSVACRSCFVLSCSPCLSRVIDRLCRFRNGEFVAFSSSLLSEVPPPADERVILCPFDFELERHGFSLAQCLLHRRSMRDR